jgi:hypothetical protein
MKRKPNMQFTALSTIDGLIKELEHIREKHGNLPVVLPDFRNRIRRPIQSIVAVSDKDGNPLIIGLLPERVKK